MRGSGGEVFSSPTLASPSATAIFAPLTLHDLLGSFVPHRRGLAEIRIVGHMAANRRVVAKYLIFYNGLPATNCVEEIRLVVCNRIVIGWSRERLRFLIHSKPQRCWFRIALVPLFHVLISQSSRPAVD